MLTDLQTFWRGNRPAWMQHMFSHVLIDADIAIQARVDYNRLVYLLAHLQQSH